MDDRVAALKAIEEWDEGSIDDQIIKTQKGGKIRRVSETIYRIKFYNTTIHE